MREAETVRAKHRDVVGRFDAIEVYECGYELQMRFVLQVENSRLLDLNPGRNRQQRAAFAGLEGATTRT
jgi:hypothetical protein